MTDYPGRMGWFQAGPISMNDVGPTITVGVQPGAVPCNRSTVSPPVIQSAFHAAPVPAVGDWVNPQTAKPAVETTARKVVEPVTQTPPKDKLN